MKIKAICLAAGEGKRMKSTCPKVLHEICGLPMLEWVLRATRSVDERPVVVVGHGRDAIMAAYEKENVDFVVQEEQLGTGHAVMVARDAMTQEYTHVMITAGDMPMLDPEDLQQLAKAAEGYEAVVATAIVADPTGYGRIVKDEQGAIRRIVEHRDATEEERAIREINLALYVFRREALLEALTHLKNDTAQGEYYLTDTIAYIAEHFGGVRTLVMDEIKGMGVNNRVQLAEAMTQRRKIINHRHMLSGVTLIDPENTYIDEDVILEQDVTVYPGNVLLGKTYVEKDSVLYNGNLLSNVRIPAGSSIGPGKAMEAKTE